MKKILCISHSCGLHGAEQVLIAAIKILIEAGCKVWVVLPSIAQENELKNELINIIGKEHILLLPYRSAGKSLVRTKLVELYNIYSVLFLRNFIRTNSIDVIYSNTSVNILGAQLARLTKTKHIWHFHEPVSSLYGWTDSLKNLYRKFINKQPCKIIFISNKQQKDWEQTLAVHLPSAIIYNPVAPFILPANTNPHKCLRIGFAGHFEQRKNISLLINAFLNFHKSYHDSELWLCGVKDEEERQRLQSQYTDNSNILFIIHTKDMGTFYRELDIFALPSFSETMPLVSIEAMRAGVCVLQTTESGLSEIYENGKDCFFLSPTDESAWVSAFKKCTDNTFRTTIAENGRRKTQSNDFNGQFKQKILNTICES